jgi:hypothetical protein
MTLQNDLATHDRTTASPDKPPLTQLWTSLNYLRKRNPKNLLPEFINVIQNLKVALLAALSGDCASMNQPTV